ncbi:MAG: 3-phosphoglycerate dehydrogenase [Candidatus Altiarchaeales archaeon]|nr:MAG: 3-phosphoglycerate dehydrogenase [Candidatus Altiarchaeales archaeon]
MFRVLICDKVSEKCVAKLRAAGFQLDFVYKPSIEDLSKIIGRYDAVIVRSSTRITREVIDRASRLKVIARAGAGLDNIDISYAVSRGIAVLNAPEALSIAVAEHVFALLLTIFRNICLANNSMKRGEWIKHALLGRELFGKTIGIIGLGRIGVEVAKRAKAFGMNVIAYIRRPKKIVEELNISATFSLEELLRNSDIITLHIPLTPQTRHMIGEREIALMKDGVVIINTSRGAVIDGKALLKGLKSGKVLAAGIDVWVNEPPKETWELELVKHPRVIATPHIGSMTREAQDRVGEIIAQKIIDYFKINIDK